MRHVPQRRGASDDALASRCSYKACVRRRTCVLLRREGSQRRGFAVDFDASPEGHALRFNAAGKLIGVTILNARWLLEHEGKITITIPERLEVEAAALGEALTAA